jgi:glycerate dehydrogenase
MTDDLCGVILDEETLGDGLDLSPLLDALPHWDRHPISDQSQIVERIADADVVVLNKVELDRAIIDAAPKLKLIALAATGSNNVDLIAARERGIAVCNVTAYGTPAVSQHVFALLLALATRLFDYRQAVRDGRWSESAHFCLFDYPIVELAGKTLGIVGYGELGRGVAKLADAFGMRVLIAQRPGGEAQADRIPLAELLPQVDALSLHCPLNDATRGLIGADELALMKPSAFLINTARGGIVDEQALADALRTGKLAGAGFDVLSSEPPKLDNPLLAADVPNLIVTPHTAWAARESRQRVVEQVALNIRCFLDGAPRNLLNPAENN